MAKKQTQLQKIMNWAVILCEGSHVFCCVLPTLFSVISVMVGLGMVATMPGWLDGLHVVMHDWEVPAIIFSGVVIALGWALHFIAQRINCHAEGCHHDHEEEAAHGHSHEHDAPAKQGWFTSNKILKIATVLFFINIAVYVSLHRGQDEAALAHEQSGSYEEIYHGHDH